MCHLKLLKARLGHVTQKLWLPDWYREYRKAQREYTYESEIYEKRAWVWEGYYRALIPREGLAEAMEEGRLYPLIVGEHGTGSLP
jgi:hypothetical protein